MEELRRKLLAQAYLFDDPTAYEAGVEDALDILRGADLLPTSERAVAGAVPA